MPRNPKEKNLTGDVPRDLWKLYEAWAKGRNKISNSQLQIAFVRLFMAVPEDVKQWAFTGGAIEDFPYAINQKIDEDALRRKILEVVREAQAEYRAGEGDPGANTG